MTTPSFRSGARLLFATLCTLLLIAPLQAQLAPIPGRLLLRLSKGAEPARIQRDLQAVLPAAWGDVQLKALGEGGRYHLLVVDDATADAERMAALVKGLRGVEATQVDLPVQRRAQPNDPLYGDQWHLLDMNVEPVWNSTIGGATATGQRIAVGIVDSGVQGSHPDLADNIVLDLVAADEHGTAVAGVVGAVGNNGVGVSGVNWDVDLLSAATVNTLSDVFTQFQFCLNQRTLFNQSNGSQGRMIVAVTASWGFPGVGCGFGEPLFDDLGAAGILVVTAGPNDATDIDVTPDYPSTCPNANNIVVTSYGPAGQVPYAVGDNTVHLLAPGVDIMTTGLGGTYGAVDGNSFAIPAVAGAVALLYSNDCVTFAQGITSDPQGTALQVKQAILNGVAPFPGGNAITITGGKLDVHGAYQQLAAQCAPCASVVVDLVTPAGTSAQYSVVNGLGSGVASGTGNAFTFCAADGCFTATVGDGNGPVNGTFTATLQGTVVASGAITNGAFGFTLGTPVQGCTNANAINYDPNAQCDDGSCCTEGLVQVSILTDEQGLSGTVELTVTQAGTVVHDGPLPVFDLPGLGVSGAQLTFCQAPGCLTVEVGSSDVPLSTLSLIRTFDGQDLQEFFFVPSEGFSGAVGPAPPELCDGLDNDCDGAVDEDFLWYADADQDGWGDASTEALFCTAPTGAFTQQPGDCNDGNAAIFPGASDLCSEADGVDNDCNGIADDPEGTFWFADADNDGWGTDLDILLACTQPPGYAANGGDCNDAEAGVNPGATELCDGLDNDCDGTTDEGFQWYVDADGDGFGDPATVQSSCTPLPGRITIGGDCDDDNASVQQGFTLFVLTNDPGDFGTAHYVIQHGGGVLEGDLDLPQETEGIGELAVCIANGCYTISISQNDVQLWEEAYLVFPNEPDVQQPFSTFDGYQGGGSAEVCDGVDNDCDGVVDEGCGNCDETHRAWILANQATIENIIAANLNACLGSGDQLACFTAALVQGTPLPAACASCVAQRYVCIIGSCLAPCVGGFGSPACDACVNSTCNAAYFNCAGFTDNDGDGVVAEQDCDDSNANVFPGANELCDTIDNDCDGLVDETPTTYFADNDGDGWGDENNPVQGGCNPPNGATSQGGDCDDSDPDIFPGAPELCNGIDDDCNGAVDDSAGLQYFVDADNDGFGASGSGIFSCTPIPGRITTGGDCNDTNLNIYPGAPDPCDNVDQDCSGGPFRTTWYQDSDGDGFGNDAVITQDCTQPAGFVASGGDCDDTDNAVFPGNGCSTCTLSEQAWIAANQQALLAAVNDCALQCSGDPNCLAACVQNSGVPLGAVCLTCIDGYLLCTQDNCSFACLNAPEFCFSCQVQAGCLATLATCMGQVDADGDGWWAGSDCDDSNANAFPGATETCDGVDNNCDGTTDEGISVTYYTDADGDGFGVDGTGITGTCTAPPGTATQGGDCDDADDTVFPGAPELCDGIDNNCDELIDNEAGTLYYTDADGDGYGDDATGQFSCTTIPGTVTVGGDCNDANAAINPGAADPCDAIDQDCSGGPVLSTWYQDNDVDGFGNTAVSVSDCTQPVGFVAQGGDCDDTNNDLYPGNGCATCTVTEQQWLAANQVTLLSALNSCSAQCLTGTPECITSCLQDEGVPVGAICLTCVSDYFSCTFTNCALPCLNSAEACLECQLQSGCFATFASCLGMVDADGDGWWAGSDCDDNDAAVNPGASEACNGVDDDCDGTADNNAGDVYYPDADGDGFGDTDAMVLSCTPVSGLITQGGDCNDSDPAVNPLGTESCNGLDDDCDGTVDEDCVLLDLKVLLDGPYNPSTGLMNDGLRALGLVPTTEPYSALGYSYTGGSATTTSPVVLAATGPDAIVDWVVVELRAGTDPTILVASRCALLQRDGDVVDLDGISPLSIPSAPGDRYVALRHRNHLGVMTAVPFTLSNVPTTIDLRTAAEACFGADARRSVSGAFPATTLWTGDVDRNNVVRYTGPANDRDPLLQAIGGAVPTNTTTGYLPQDVNMDGVVRYVGAANDRDPILQTVGGSVPTNTRSGTLP